MNDELQEIIADRFAKRFSKFNEKVLHELGKVIKELGEVIPSDAYKLAQQLKYNTTIKDLEKELAKITGKSIQEIKEVLEYIAKENIQFAEPFYKARGLNVPIYENHGELQRIVNSMATLSNNEFINIARSTGFKLLDLDKKPLLLNMEETYHRVIDEAVYAITTGKESYNQLMRNTLKQLASSGVRKIEYDSGYTRRLDTAIRMNILDTMRQVSNETSKQFGKEFNSDGVEVSVHISPAPDHEDVQGHQFSNKEFEKFQNHLDCVDYKGNEIHHKHNKYERRAISEYNCYHYIFPVILSISKPLYDDKELQDIILNNNKGVEIDGKHYTNYEVTQLQRQLETEIKKTKEQNIIAQASGDDELTLKSQQRITSLMNKYKQISKQTNMEVDIDRTYVPNYKSKKIKQDLSYKDLTEQLKNMNGNPNPIERRLNYSIDSEGNKHYDFYFEDDKKIREEIIIQKKLEEITGYKVYLNPKTRSNGYRSPDFWIEDTNELWDLKGIDGNSEKVIDNILHTASDKKFQTSNLILKQRKTFHEIGYLKEKIKEIFDKNQRQKIKQVILLDNEDNVIVYYKR